MAIDLFCYVSKQCCCSFVFSGAPPIRGVIFPTTCRFAELLVFLRCETVVIIEGSVGLVGLG